MQLRLTHAYVYPNHGKINLAKAASSLQRLIEVLLSLISVLLLSSKPYPVHEREQHFSTKISSCADLFLSCLKNHEGGNIHGYFKKIKCFWGMMEWQYLHTTVMNWDNLDFAFLITKSRILLDLVLYFYVFLLLGLAVVCILGFSLYFALSFFLAWLSCVVSLMAGLKNYT